MFKIKKYKGSLGSLKIRTKPPPSAEAKCLANLSMGYPVGMIQGSIPQKKMIISTSTNHLISLQYCYVAFAHSFIQSVLTWTAETMNEILVQATELYQESVRLDSFETLNETKIQTKFTWLSYLIEVQLQMETITGFIMTKDTNVKNLYRGFRSFFIKSQKACILSSRKKCFLVWKNTKAFYVLDLQGRQSNGIVDTSRGFISLLCFETISNLTYFLVNISNMYSDEPFALSELKLKTLMKSSKVPMTMWDATRMNKWRILDSYRAILRGNFCSKNECFSKFEIDMPLASCCMIVFYSRMSPPNSWDGRILDKVLLLAHQFTIDCINHHQSKHISLKNILKTYTIGTYKMDISIRENIANGQLLYSLSFKQTELRIALKNYFQSEDKSKYVLIEAGIFTFVIWKSGGLFYYFDSYDRDSTGRLVENNVGSSCLMMHSTLDSLCSMLIENLLKVAPKKQFYLHELAVIVQCQKCRGQNVISSLGSDDECDDRKSVFLNESVDDLYLPAIVCKMPEDMSICESASEVETDQNMSSTDESHASGEEIDLGISKSGSSTDEEEYEVESNNIFGLPNDEYTNLKELEITDEDEIKQYKKFKLNLCEMKKLFDLNISSDEYDGLRKSGLKYDDIVYMKENNISLEDYLQMKRQGLENSDIDKIREYSFDSDEYIAGKRKNLTIEEMLEIRQIGWTVDEYATLNNMGLSMNDTKCLKELNVTIDDFEKLTKNGVDLQELSEIVNKGIPVDKYLDWKKEGFNIEDMIELKSKGDAPDESTERLDKSENMKIEIKKHEKIQNEKEEKKTEAENPKAKISNVKIGSNAANRNSVGVENITENPIDPSLKKKMPIDPPPNIPCAIENANSEENISNSRIQYESITLAESTKYSSNLDAPIMSVDRNAMELQKKNLAVVASSSGTPKSILKLITTSFQMVDRVLIKTSWGEFVAFVYENSFALYEGCACNLDNIRRLDLSKKHSFLLYFDKLESLIVKILESKNRQQIARRKSSYKIQTKTTQKIKDSGRNSTEEYSDVKIQYAMNVIGNKIEKLSREASTILNQFRAIQH